MEINSDVYMAKSGSQSVWNSNGNGMETFSRSSSRNREFDEEALNWAALEKLPTYSRLRKGLLSSSRREAVEIDVNNLGLKERTDLIRRLVDIADEGNENFLLKLKNRIDRVGIKIPTIEVRFENLKVEAEAYVGSRALTTFSNFFISAIERVLINMRIITKKRQKLTVLDDISGIIKPGRMTLLLGPPSSGKTTFLLALAGKLDKELQFSGNVTYNGHGMNEFVPERTAAYISQHDTHIGEMTVRETLSFSARFQGVGSRYDMLVELSRRERLANIKPDLDLDLYMKAAATQGRETSVVTDYVLRILGLEGCADTVVGNSMLRGISGGQRKRVTIGEMLVGPANVFFMDEISTGLDSSTTYQIVNSLKKSAEIYNHTTVISLLQPAPETYNLFDDIILLSDGQIIYQGPRESVLEFFNEVGFQCPERKGIADFLQEVTSRKDQEQYWARKDHPYIFATTEEFSDAFQNFHIGRRLRDELGTRFDKRNNHRAALTTRKFGLENKELLKACFSREFLLMKRNSFVYASKLIQLAILSSISITVFLRTEMHRNTVEDGVIYAGALFYSIFAAVFNGQIELPMTVAKLPVFFKHRSLLFFPSWAYALPLWIIKIPRSFIEAAIWILINYYAIGFDPNVERFFRQFLLLVLMSQMSSSLCRSIAALSRNIIIGSTVNALAFVIMITLGGFVLSRDEIKKWWIWGYWISPLMYCQNALVTNEFLGKSWAHVPPNSTTSLGVMVLESRGFFTESYWFWLGVVVLLGYVLIFNFCLVLCLTYLNPWEKQRAVIPGDDNGGDISSSSKFHSKRNYEIKSRAAKEIRQSNRKGMILPFEPHSISFDDITYSVDMPPEMKSQGVAEDKLVLLKGVSGSFRPGVLTALMGVSGAGKTTLMDVLAGRKTGSYIDGSIRISGYPKKQETFARISGYCEQNDIHSPHVTVYESLVYSAWLRLPSSVDSKTRMMFIEEVMELMELNPLREAIVGLPGMNGLSTEQRKRLTIAVELVANPSIVFMDEPTSGLDARAAAIVMRTVRNTVDTGRTVVCTIHHPSIHIFEAFDELLLLKRGGEEIYVGPLGRHSCHLINYFEGIEGVRKIKDGCNPATWMLEITSPAQEVGLGVDFAELYKSSELYRRNKELINQLSRPSDGSEDLHFPTKYSQPFLTQCRACLWKQRLSYWRNPPYTAFRFLFTSLIGFIFGTMFWGLGSKRTRQQNLINAMGSMYGGIPFIGTQNASSVQPVIAIERTVFYREKAAGMYSAFPYSFAQVVVELPYILAQSVVYCLFVYSMIGFEWTTTKFAWYIFFTFCSMAYYTLYGMMAVAATPNTEIAAVVSSAFYGIWSLFSGFIIPRTRIPIWWRWYVWICPVAWTLYGLVASQYGDVTDVMESGETVEEFVRRYFGFEHDYLAVVAIANIAFSVVFAFVFAFAIRIFNFQKR